MALTPSPASSVEGDTYRIDKLASLGGPLTRGSTINEQGDVAGFSGLPDSSRRAVVWRDGTLHDLGTLGGRHSAVLWTGLNHRGMIAGISRTGVTDTLGGTWSCNAFIAEPTKTCLGFFYHDGKMTALPTLGGDNGFATDVNDQGEVVGWAETRVSDPSCVAPQRLQFRAVLWEPLRNRKRELRPWPGDSTSAATAINNGGQVVGISGKCDVAVGRFSALRVVLWDQRGDITNIGSLGGLGWHTPTDVSEHGVVVGFSNPASVTDGSFRGRGFIWTKNSGMDSLTVLPGHTFSQAFGVNDRGQVVGRSCLGAACRAVTWIEGRVIDLNDFREPGSTDVLDVAQDVNEAGVITGRVVEGSSGKRFAFTATPGRRR